MSDLLPQLDGFAGIASLINSLILWPVIRSLKALSQDHGARLTALETRRLRNLKRSKARSKR